MLHSECKHTTGVVERCYHLFVQVMAYVTVAAVVAALQSGVLGRTGQAELQWMKVCNMYGKFCNQMGEGITSDFVVSLSVVVISYRERGV